MGSSLPRHGASSISGRRRQLPCVDADGNVQLN